METKPNELIVDKACALWVEMLSNPKFDALGKNGGLDDPNGSMLMASTLASSLADKQKASPESLQKFAEALKKYLTSLMQYTKEGKLEIAERGYYHSSMDVDYHPCALLALAANDAGISHNLFPWKTHLTISENCLCLRYGYGSESLYYYPFDGRWLITTLYGSEIEKVIEYVKGGKPEFTVIEG